MDKVTAVKETIKMWEWLRDNPDEGKAGYFDTISEEK